MAEQLNPDFIPARKSVRVAGNKMHIQEIKAQTKSYEEVTVEQADEEMADGIIGPPPKPEPAKKRKAPAKRAPSAKDATTTPKRAAVAKTTNAASRPSRAAKSAKGVSEAEQLPDDLKKLIVDERNGTGRKRSRKPATSPLKPEAKRRKTDTSDQDSKQSLTATAPVPDQTTAAASPKEASGVLGLGSVPASGTAQQEVGDETTVSPKPRSASQVGNANQHINEPSQDEVVVTEGLGATLEVPEINSAAETSAVESSPVGEQQRIPSTFATDSGRQELPNAEATTQQEMDVDEVELSSSPLSTPPSSPILNAMESAVVTAPKIDVDPIPTDSVQATAATGGDAPEPLVSGGEVTLPISPGPDTSSQREQPRPDQPQPDVMPTTPRDASRSTPEPGVPRTETLLLTPPWSVPSTKLDVDSPGADLDDLEAVQKNDNGGIPTATDDVRATLVLFKTVPAEAGANDEDGETVEDLGWPVVESSTSQSAARRSATPWPIVGLRSPPSKNQTAGTATSAVVSKGRVEKPRAARKAPRKSIKADDQPEQSLKKPTASKAPAKRGKSMPLSKIVVLTPPPSWEHVELDSTILSISRKLMHREHLTAKPLPVGQPRVWAESRQALCETLPYFKSTQGGCYQNDGHVYGFLFDGMGHCREYLDGDIIICRAGGGMETEADGTGMAQSRDQTFKEAQVQAILNDIKHENPLVVICGNRNLAAPSKMPHQYCALGWYKPTMVWSEKTAGKGKKVWKTVKYRLERLNRTKPAWHSPSESEVLGELEKAAAGESVETTCTTCQKRYHQVYLRGWICLNADCERFWKYRGMDVPYGKDGLEYSPAFLLYQSKLWKNETDAEEPEPTDLRPAVPDVGNVIGDNLAFELFPQHRPIAPAMLHTPWDAAPTLIRNSASTLERKEGMPGVNISIDYKQGYKIATYTFDGIDGCFVHGAATKVVLREAVSGPDAMFAAIQNEDMGLERRTFAVKKMSKGQNELTNSAALPTPPADVQDDQLDTLELSQANAELEAKSEKYTFEDGDLMTAFSMNYGMPYKFVASGSSKPFEEAPWPVTECRRRLNWAQRAFLHKQEGYEDFNEQLIFAYLEGQKIEYHDDGEEGLGARIASLSLGGRAKMHMRMKQKHFVGCSKTGIFTEEEPVVGGIDGPEMDEKRHNAWRTLQDLKGDGPTYNKRRKEIPKELGIYEKRTKKADDLVTVTLNHGDIILMEGYDIQKYLEHKVAPEGYLRFALTCRTVLENHLKEHEKPGYSVAVDPEEYEGPKI
ncbi:hypothetical protein LTR09_008105 [Extremus antarcticus]|uniref:Alpha-ketoglutarate-dependent dioxygenase AlkB-like domain-containing protein n=1 Tax=Extremus antarcticus TaxID=702011 RepID=A0AAJ0DIB6_9PEZI|nr:hypothetical protein LTR09_008105 [Extremus antarcticus]